MKQSLDVSQIGPALRKFLRRFHVMIFTFTVLVGLTVAIFLLSQALSAASDTSAAEPAPVSPGRFDEATMKKIETLNRANEGRDIDFPRGRTSPFVE